MTDLSANPLLNPPKLPNGAPALDRVKAEHVLPAIKAAIAENKAEIEAIKNNPAAPTFANTIEALEFSGTTLGRVSLVFANISLANSDDALRAIEEEVDLETTRHGNDISLDAALFARIKAVYDQKDSLNLDPVQMRLLENSYKGFVRSGALLDEGKKQELREINEKLSALGTTYSQNVLKSTNAYEKVIDDEETLKGVPERAKNDYRAAAEEKGLHGKFLIKLSPPPLDILDYAENRALREEIYRARLSVAHGGEFDNGPVILDIIRMRQRRAELMGFKNHAEFVLEDRMAKTPDTVMAFLQGNADVYRPAAEAHLKEVKAFAKKRGQDDIQPWDYAFYDRQLKEEKFNLKVEDLRPYFDLEKVLVGLRRHAEKLFGITLNEQPAGKYPVYHQDVKVFEVNDQKTGELLGVFYGDYFARPGAKKGGAWEYKFRGRGEENGVDQIPLVVNVCNYAKPANGQPSLLSFDDVTTLFHEFGHALHDLLARGKYPSLNGTSVKWDFVELPSQVQENWARKKEVLDTFARHHQTNEPLPADLIKKLNDMENFGTGYIGLRQTFLGLLDMTWHTTDPSTIKSVEELEDRIVNKVSLFPRVAGPMSSSFSHIFAGGYSAGYYGYKWAEVLDADVFDAFEKKGLYDQELASLLRKTVYEKGDNEDPSELFRRLMGRDPDSKALYRREGLEIIERKLGGIAPPPPAPPQGPRI